MKFKLKTMAPVAVAVAALCASPVVFAGSTVANGQVSLVNSMTSSSNSNNALLENNSLQNAAGNISVNAAAGVNNAQANSTALSSAMSGNATAVALAAQYAVGTYYSGESNSNDAYIRDNALQNAKGNIAVNAAAGEGNQQQNGLAVSVSNAPVGNATAFVFGVQATAANTYSYDDASNQAEIEDQGLQNAAGNISVNIAAGAGNQQGNSTAIAVSNKGLANAAAVSLQVSAANYTTDNDDNYNEAALEQNALQNASGNIAVNLAAGNGNQQSNSLAIAVTK